MKEITKFAEVGEGKATWEPIADHSIQVARVEGVRVVTALSHPATCNGACPVEGAMENWTEWSGIDPRQMREVEVPDAPDAVTVLGGFYAVEYETDKWTPGEMIVYRHEFSRRPHLPLLTRGPTDLHVVRDGSRYRFTKRGIVG